MKKFMLAVFLIFFSTILIAETKTQFQGKLCNGTFQYNEKVFQGDALVIRMTISLREKKRFSKETKAIAILQNEKKNLETVQFFFKNPKAKKQNTQELFALVPISTWINGGKYNLKIVYEAFDAEAEKVSLPISVLEKKFVSETIPLNEKNTNIRTDNSRERMAQIDKLNAILSRVSPNNVFTLSQFIEPVQTTRRTSFFGDRRIYEYASGKKAIAEHYGIDYGVGEGTPVSACADGKVVLAENRNSTGWSIVIEHAPGLYSLYYHLSSLSVKEGSAVKQGEKIATSGSTGLATGPHLHWEVRLNACAVSPDFFCTNFAYQTK